MGALWLAASRRYAEEMLERECSDSIMVGASDRRRFVRALLGDDAVASVDGSPCAIAIAPPGHRRGQGV